MMNELRRRFHELKSAEPGRRFQEFHAAEQHRPRAIRLAFLVLAIALIPVGVLFAFIPGPAVLFFAISAALFAAQSSFIACQLDRFELAGRHAASRLRDWFRRRVHRTSG